MLELLGSAAHDAEMHIEMVSKKHEIECAVDDAFISCWVGQFASHRQWGWLGCRHRRFLSNGPKS